MIEIKDRAKYKHEHYIKNREKYLARNKARKIKAKQHTDYVKTKRGCLHCGYNEHPAALDFHHRDPNSKDSNLRNGVGSGWTIERLDKEIEKCDVLCANCHRIEHFKQQ